LRTQVLVSTECGHRLSALVTLEKQDAVASARLGLSSLEVVWLVFEFGFVLDQTHQSFKSGFPSRTQWRVGYAFFFTAMMLRTAFVLLPAGEEFDENDCPHWCFRSFQIVLSLNALTHSLEIVPVICEIGFDNMHMHTHRVQPRTLSLNPESIVCAPFVVTCSFSQSCTKALAYCISPSSR
jgi:hypothetical protein